MLAPHHITNEIEQIPNLVAESADFHLPAIEKAVQIWKSRERKLFVTIARGSSDHAAAYLRSAFEIALGLPSASVSPSIASIYERQINLSDAICLVVSQSGRSPDIQKAAQMARRGGAAVIALINDETSPLADDADVVIPVAAGKEKAVASTKSFVCSAIAGLRLLSRLQQDESLSKGILCLQEIFHQSLSNKMIDLEPVLKQPNAVVLGRGPSLGIAQEAALKMKEILRYPAEAFSSAEVMHGPWELVESGCAAIGWATDERAQQTQLNALKSFKTRGAAILDLQPLTIMQSSHPIPEVLYPLLPLPAFYKAIVEAAKLRGIDPDQPKNLNKVTETL